MHVISHIPESTRETYPKSFLYYVALLLAYKSQEENVEMCHKYMRENGWMMKEKNSDENLLYKGDIMYAVTSNGLLVNIPKLVYRGFDNLGDVWDNLNNIFNILSVSEFLGIHLNKSNRFIFPKELGQDKEWMKGKLFSDAYLKETDEDGLSCNDGRYWIQMDFNVISEHREEKEVDVLSFILSASKLGNVNVRDLRREVTAMNDKLFSAWRWAISENIVKVMEDRN